MPEKFLIVDGHMRAAKTLRFDHFKEPGGIARGQTDTAVGYSRSKMAGIIGAVDCDAAIKENSVRHRRVVILF